MSRALACWVTAAALAGASACATGRAARGAERPPAPAFAVSDLDGAPVSSEQLKGKVVVVDFWATWCEPCREELPRLIALQKAEGPRGLQLVGLSMDDDAATVRAFCRAQGVNYPMAMGDAELGQKFGGVLGVPVKVVIDRKGRVAARHTGAVDIAVLTLELRALLVE